MEKIQQVDANINWLSDVNVFVSLLHLYHDNTVPANSHTLAQHYPPYDPEVSQKHGSTSVDVLHAPPPYIPEVIQQYGAAAVDTLPHPPPHTDLYSFSLGMGHCVGQQQHGTAAGECILLHLLLVI